MGDKPITVGIFYTAESAMSGDMEGMREFFSRYFSVRIIAPGQVTNSVDVFVIPDFEGYDTTRSQFFHGRGTIPHNFKQPETLVKNLYDGIPPVGYKSQLDFYYQNSLVVGFGNAGMLVLAECENCRLDVMDGRIVYLSGLKTESFTLYNTVECLRYQRFMALSHFSPHIYLVEAIEDHCKKLFQEFQLSILFCLQL